MKMDGEEDGQADKDDKNEDGRFCCSGGTRDRSGCWLGTLDLPKRA